MQTVEAVCPDCLGEVWTDPCRRCFGAGSVIQFRMGDGCPTMGSGGVHHFHNGECLTCGTPDPSY
jgi:hypothetical protein